MTDVQQWGVFSGNSVQSMIPPATQLRPAPSINTEEGEHEEVVGEIEEEEEDEEEAVGRLWTCGHHQASAKSGETESRWKLKTTTPAAPSCYGVATVVTFRHSVGGTKDLLWRRPPAVSMTRRVQCLILMRHNYRPIKVRKLSHPETHQQRLGKLLTSGVLQ